MLLAESQRINNKNLEKQTNLDKTVVRKLSKKYRLDNYYYDSTNTHFFEMSKLLLLITNVDDRFHRKKFLIFCFSAYALDNICVIFFLFFLLIFKNEPKLVTSLQIGLLIETVLLNIIGWNTFMKLEISRVYLY